MSLLLERNEERHQKALQNMCNMPTTQTRECEIQEENLQAITSTHGFYLHKLNRQIPPPTSHGHHYALTAVCMLTGFTWCIPLKTKTAEEVAKAYMDHIYSNFGGSIKILMDNRTEFKNKLFKEVVEKLARRYFNDDNGLPNIEALKNIYQVVAQQLLNSRERYMKKHHNQQ